MKYYNEWPSGGFDYEDKGDEVESLWPDEWLKELIIGSPPPEKEILPEELFEI